MKNLRKVIIGTAAAAVAGSAMAVPVVLDLLTDDFAGETSFEMALMLDGINIAYDSWSSPTDPGFPGLDDGFVETGDLLSATQYTFTWDLGAGVYEFTILDSFADGICCGFGLGEYTLSVDGDVVGMGGAFGASETTLFTIADMPSVSEPGTVLLFGLGIAGLALSRRFRRA